MKLKSWLLIFFISLAAFSLCFAAFNIAVDPFGVFGDRLLDYWTYDMTQNPRIAKIAYLDRNYEKYDSYIIGSSKTSSYSVDKLNEYTGASFYNMIMYGGDLYDAQKTAEYVIENYNVKNLILNIGIEESVQYDQEDDPVKGNLHAKTDGGNLALFYLKYAFLNPQYSTDKLKAYFTRDYLPSANEVFIPETGVYNKTVRDVETVGRLLTESDTDAPFFIPRGRRDELMNTDNAVAAVKAVKELCNERGIDFKLIASPLYDTEIQDYSYAGLCEYWQKLAEVTEFYDFTGYSDISMDSRYFYDDAHFRNSVGDMVLAYIYGDDSIYIPEDFGHITTAENAYAFASERFARPAAKDTANYTKSVPILMYHNIAPVSENDMTITPEQLEGELAALVENGYTAVSFAELEDYVNHRTTLPEKPVVITFDDGYLGNYEYAYPLLVKYGIKATIFTVGVTFGRDTYKDTGEPITPHFNYDQAREMTESGLVEIASHTYDFHKVEKLDGAQYRDGASKLPGESDTDFAALFTADILRSKTELESNLNRSVTAFSYPQGIHSTLTDVCVKKAGFAASVTVTEAPNIIIKGLPQTLYDLNRIGVYPGSTPEELIDRIERNGGTQ